MVFSRKTPNLRARATRRALLSSAPHPSSSTRSATRSHRRSWLERRTCQQCRGPSTLSPISTTFDQRRKKSASRSSSRPASAAEAGACVSCRTPASLRESWRKRSVRRAAAFGRSDVFVERFVRRAKHIEVQILGDRQGNLVHVWERDCSVQRRHQKVVEIAPSINLSRMFRERMCVAAVRLCQAIRYQSAGTVEFLVDIEREEFYFIEVNPRIQVEHTVTEVVTGIDLVRGQILIAQGHALHEPPLSIPRQEDITTAGVAIQCRITTEDPENHFIPDYGRISTYRSPGGFAVRLDGGNGFGGAVITPYFDSLLVKMTTWGQTLEEAVRRTDRSLREFRIRGVKTNIAFLDNLILHPTFMSGAATTEFVDSTPELFRFRAPRDRATKILSYLGDVIVNGRPDVKDKIDRTRTLRRPVAPQIDQAMRARVPAETAGSRTGEIRAVGTCRAAAAVYRHDHARRASIAPGNACPDVRPARGCRGRGARSPEPVQPRNVGRRDVRYVDAVPAGGSLGSSGAASRADPEHPVSDAAAREQHGRLHELSGQCREGVHQEERRARHRRVPHLRLVEFDAEHGSGDGGGANRDERDLRSGHLLYRRHPRSLANEIHTQILRADGRGARRDGRAYPCDQGHGRVSASPTRRTRW